MSRVCSVCRVEKSLEAYAKSKYSPAGIRYACKDCDNALRRAHAAGAASITKPPPKANAPRPKIVQETLPRANIQSRTKVLAIGDFHAPFHHHGWLSWVMATVEELQPDVVVQMGDLYDQYAHSRYPRSLTVMGADDEEDRGRAHAEFLWSEVRRLATNASCYQIMGNHDDRSVKRIIERSPEHERPVRNHVRELYTFDGVTTVEDSTEELEIDGVLYMHGYRTRIGDHAAWNRQSTVCGHKHIGGVVMMQEKEGSIWELNAGWGGDRTAPVFSYHSQKRMHGTTLGLGRVDSMGPAFMPYLWA